uniref:Unique cartilage matrix-associated protein n=1 Tax=Chelonoidis abingdonii TaxID=106734 RepID=A0A8C0J3B7_CHEAB
MNWKEILFLSCLATFVLLVGMRKVAPTAFKCTLMPLFTIHGRSSPLSLLSGVKKKIFIQGSDASNFFKKRGKRATKSRDELNAETRQMLIADEQRREYFEEQRNKFENFVKEEHKEQQERSREQIEQWRQYHYDGLYPSYMYNRHHI